MTDIKDLIRQVESGETGRALDWTMKVVLGGGDWEVDEDTAREADALEDSPPKAPHYTTSLDAALPGENIVKTEKLESHWFAYHEGSNGKWHHGIAQTEPAARRAARLREIEGE